VDYPAATHSQQSMVELIGLLATVYRSDKLSRALSVLEGRDININEEGHPRPTSTSVISDSERIIGTSVTAGALSSDFQYLHDQFVAIAVNNIYDKYMSGIHSHALQSYHHHRKQQSNHSNRTGPINRNGCDDDSIRDVDGASSYCSAQYHQLLLVIFLYQSHPYTIGHTINSDGKDAIIGRVDYDAHAKKNIEGWLKFVELLMYYRHIIASSSSSTASTNDGLSTDAMSIDAAETVNAVVIDMNNHDGKRRLFVRYQSQALEWMLLIIQTYFINSHQLSETSTEVTTVIYNDVLMKTNKLLRRIERDYLWSVAGIICHDIGMLFTACHGVQ